MVPIKVDSTWISPHSALKLAISACRQVIFSTVEARNPLEMVRKACETAENGGETGRRGSFQPSIKRPEPPSFAEPADGTKAALPRALQAGGGMLGLEQDSMRSSHKMSCFG